MSNQSESDLYVPIKRFLEKRGYTAKAEVKGVDLVANHPYRETVLVEMKKTFNLKLVFQGVDRLALTDRVYLAVRASTSPGNVLNQDYKSVKKLCRRLGLGLIQVYFSPHKTRVDILVEPGPYKPRKRATKLQALQDEFSGRQGDPNTGGINRQKIMTAYRQQVIKIALCLEEREECSLGHLREISGSAKTASILQKNFYGWFERTGRGRYRLTETGRAECEAFLKRPEG